MKYATLTKLGGELIEAIAADYSDYKGFLRCPECGEPVFLRKSHKRGETEVPDAFVHHKAIPEVSACELRVGRYSLEDVVASRAKARGQRLATLKISLWKFLKTSLAVNFKSWSKYVRDAKQIKMLGEVVEYGEEVLATNRGFILDSTLPRVARLVYDRDSRLATSPDMAKIIEGFLDLRSRDWQLHQQIAREALELFLDSSAMAEIRHRALCCLCHPQMLKQIPDLLDLDAATTEWREKFAAYLTLEIAIVFLLVDWIGIWEKE